MDYSELKRLAEAATPGPWKRGKGHVSHSATYNSEKENRMYAIEGPADVRDYEDWGYTKANATYMAAASPDVVLGLIAQNQAQLELNAALLMDCGVLTNKNQALLEALKNVMYWDNDKPEWDMARAAIKLAEGQDV